MLVPMLIKLKKTLIFVLNLLGVILCLIILGMIPSFLSILISGAGFFSSYFWVLILVIFILMVIISYSVFHTKYFKIKKLKWRIGIHFISVFLITICLFALSELVKNDFKNPQDQYFDGYALKGYKVFLNNDVSKKIMGSIYSILPLKAEYLLRSFDEAIFVFDLRELFDNEHEIVGCDTNSKMSCFHEIFVKLTNNKRTSTFFILMAAVEAHYIFSEKSKAKEGNKDYNQKKYAFAIINLTLFLAESTLSPDYVELEYEIGYNTGEEFNKVALEKARKLIHNVKKKDCTDRCLDIVARYEKRVRDLEQKYAVLYPEVNKEK